VAAAVVEMLAEQAEQAAVVLEFQAVRQVLVQLIAVAAAVHPTEALAVMVVQVLSSFVIQTLLQILLLSVVA
jgi:hypothetical protein